MSEHRLVGALIDHVHGQSVTGLHQRVQVLATGMHLDPARVITGLGGLQAVHERQFTRLGILKMRPDLVGRQIGRVQVGLCRVEHHAVNTGLGVIFVVLYIAIQSSVGLDGKHVTIAGVVVEGVAVDIVGGLVGGEDEDGTGVGLAAGGESYSRSAG